MSNELCFFGPPHCGKTTLALKTAKLLSETHTVILVLCDRVTPHLPWLFPKFRAEDIRSIGTALSAVDMTEEKLMNSATVSTSANLIYLGYGSGENRYSYPEFGPGRAGAFFNSLGELADYVLVDCTSDVTSDVLTDTALKRGGSVIRIYTPDMASFAFYDAQAPILAASEYRAEKHIPVLNCLQRDVCLPEREAAAAIDGKSIRIPYCKAWQQERADGRLPDTPANKKMTYVLKTVLTRAFGKTNETQTART